MSSKLFVYCELTSLKLFRLIVARVAHAQFDDSYLTSEFHFRLIAWSQWDQDGLGRVSMFQIRENHHSYDDLMVLVD